MPIMEDLMSSYSFSQQFYQRWTCAPASVRAAIIQELTDITTLLQPDTSLEDFTFTSNDLDSHVEDLYDKHAVQQAAAKEIADKQARHIAEQQRIEAQKKTDEEHARLRAELQTQQLEQQELERVADGEDTRDYNKNSPSMTSDNNIKTVVDKTGVDTVLANTIDLSLKDAKANASYETLIRELEMHIDDYLSEQMMQMSENLKSWLRAEVSQHFSASKQAAEKSTEQ